MPGTVPDYPAARLSSHVCLPAYLRTLNIKARHLPKTRHHSLLPFSPLNEWILPVTGKPLRPAVVAQPEQFLVLPAVLSHLTYSAVAEAVDFLPAPPEPRALSP